MHTHVLSIDSDAIGFAQRKRLLTAGLTVLTPDPFPWLPDNFGASLQPERLERRSHTCELERRLWLPGILTFDIRFWDEYFDVYTQTDRRFSPYWTGPVLVLHEDDEPPHDEGLRPLTAVEAVCGVVEYPEVGSLRCGQGWHQNSGQAYVSEERQGRVSMHCYGTPQGHHRAYVRDSLRPRIRLVHC